VLRKFIFKLRKYAAEAREERLLLVLSFVVGLGCGFAAVFLKFMISFFRGILTGWFNTPAYSLLYLLYPGLGMLISLLIVKFVVKENISHGVTKVLLAVSKNESRIKPHNLWSSIATSSVTIGFGGSVGSEAPIVYAGAAIGSNIARVLELSYRDMTILLGCGASGAIAGIFKAPMAGVLFTFEILLLNLSMSSLLPFVISSITATAISYSFMGNDPLFATSISPFVMGNIPLYVILGIICGFASLYFIRTTLAIEDKAKTILNPYKRWFLMAAGLGVLLFLFPPLYGEGYDSIKYLLNNNVPSAIGNTVFGGMPQFKWLVPLFFAGVFIFKVFSMSFTNAGGGVGGTFGPTLFMGGMLGFIIARTANLSGIVDIPEANFVLVGMAGLMAGVMQAPLTAIFLIAEITGGYSLFMPLIITSAVAFATIRFFEPYSIYAKRIAKQGELLTHDSDQAVLTLLKTSELIEKNFSPVRLNKSLGELIPVIAHSKRNIFPVVDKSGFFQGILYLDDIREVMFDKNKYDSVHVFNFMKQPPDFVYANDKMENAMKKFERTNAWNLPVLDVNKHYLGFVSKSKIFSAYRSRLQQVVAHD
jgi:CIC family chloride channel protein